jgi:hypothetical protein
MAGPAEEGRLKKGNSYTLELLLRCALEALAQGLNGEPMYTGYFKAKLGRAAEYYGLDVVASEPAD